MESRENSQAESHDDDLQRFDAVGAPALPMANEHSYTEHDRVRIWHAVFGSGPPVILLHGGLGHSGNWGYQVPALVESGYRVVLIDSRGHGRSTCDSRPFTYELMASDILAVMNTLGIRKAAFVGWSDGASIALTLARQAPARVEGIFYFGCNVDPSGVKPFTPSPALDRCFARHSKDYAQLSTTPDQFKMFVEAVSLMQRADHNFTACDLAEIRVPVTIAHGEHDEFIKREHAEYLARSIPGATLVTLTNVSHFAPLQRPGPFNEAVLGFLRDINK